jgi:predicted O-methyltransferase YrrM
MCQPFPAGVQWSRAVLTEDYRLKTLAKSLDEPFDMVFIDADKPSYPAYLSLIMSLSDPSSTTTRLLRPGGIILADNILRCGLVVDKSPANPWSEVFLKDNPSWNPAWKMSDLTALDEFNKALVTSKRVETFLMPLFDGLGCGRLLD